MLRILRKDTNFEAIYNTLPYLVCHIMLRILRKDTNFEAIYNLEKTSNRNQAVANTPQRYKF